MPGVNAETFRTCSNTGCSNIVKKRTAKYCSVECCVMDPHRRERIRKQVRRSAKRSILPLAKQLTLDSYMGTFNPELELTASCIGREDVPAGMSRLVG